MQFNGSYVNIHQQGPNIFSLISAAEYLPAQNWEHVV